jgi:hypothetical protein
MTSSVNDIPFEKHRSYPGHIQEDCKHIHRGQFYSPDTLEAAWRTPDDPVDLFHLPELSD